MSFPENTNSGLLKDVAKELNIDLYSRYDEKAAMDILDISQSVLDTIVKNRVISFLQLTKDKTEFFGYQLIEYLFDSVMDRTVDLVVQNDKNRIMRFPEVREISGLSRTTLWRLEKEDKFPHRVQLGKASVGWKSWEVREWVQLRSKV